MYPIFVLPSVVFVRWTWAVDITESTTRAQRYSEVSFSFPLHLLAGVPGLLNLYARMVFADGAMYELGSVLFSHGCHMTCHVSLVHAD